MQFWHKIMNLQVTTVLQDNPSNWFFTDCNLLKLSLLELDCELWSQRSQCGQRTSDMATVIIATCSLSNALIRSSAHVREGALAGVVRHGHSKRSTNFNVQTVYKTKAQTRRAARFYMHPVNIIILYYANRQHEKHKHVKWKPTQCKKRNNKSDNTTQ